MQAVSQNKMHLTIQILSLFFPDVILMSPQPSFLYLSFLHFGVVHLVGGWTNPFEKHARQNGIIFPKVRGENSKNMNETTT